jgi:TolB-like protein
VSLRGTTLRAPTLALLLVAFLGAARGARAQAEPPTLWVLPLESLADDPELDELALALSDLLALSFARSRDCAVVERARLAALLAEQSLPAAGLDEPGTRRGLGRLLGARWMLHGSLARRGTRLWIAAHVTDVESTLVLASEQFEAEPAELAPRLVELTAKLRCALRSGAGAAVGAELDPTPATTLHFLRGLAQHHAGRYHAALAEFLRAGGEPALVDLCASWRANAFLGLEEFGHAYLELARLQRRGTEALDPRSLDERLERCRRELSADELRTCETLLGLRER